MLRHFTFAVLLVPGIVLADAAPGGDKTAQKDLDAMQGVWKVVELIEKGEKLPEKERTPVGVVIKGGNMTLSDNGKFREESTLKLDATGKVKTVDLVYIQGPNKGKTERGIYEIEGDTLKFCVNEAKDGPRPAAFVSTKDNNCAVAVLKRIKK